LLFRTLIIKVSGVKVSEKSKAMIATLRERGLRITPQRIALVEAFATDESHPTAQELFERLRPAFPSMSFATVYNTLDALAQAGLSSTLRQGGAARFDPNTTPHHHAVCDTCQATFDVPAETLAPESAAAERVSVAAPGFVVERVERTYRGTCAACSKKKKQKEN
jgi:Fe2+ or Zn2+ uptake regulation protein